MPYDALYFTSLPDWVTGLSRVPSLPFWRELNPQLTISDQPFSRVARPYQVASQDVEQALEQVREEGYLQTSPAIPPEICKTLSDGVLTIIKHGLHPIFISLYDEFWQMAASLSEIMEPVLGKDYLALGDFWCWCVSPDTSGWAPHRDYQFRGPVLREDGRPTIVTAWLPLTDTDPLNGCMYVVPQNLDVNYPNDLHNFAIPAPQDIRALPARAGSVLAWNQYLLHWGGRCTKWAKAPRISVGIYLQSGDQAPFVNKPVRFDEDLPFSVRLGFIASNVLNYHQYHRYPQEVLRMCFDHIQNLPGFVSLVPPDLRHPMADYLDELSGT